MCLHFSKMSNIEHRAVINFFIRKRLNAIEISKELENVYKDSASSYRNVAEWVAEFKDPIRAFGDALRMGHPSTITADENIEAVEQIVMRDRQISIRHLAEELAIIHEITNHHMDMKKVVHTVGTEIVDTNSTSLSCPLYCQEFLQQSELNPVKFLHCIVTGDESWIHHYDPVSQLEAKVWKRLGKQTPIRLHQERSVGKIMMIIFWDEDGVPFTEYLSREATSNGPCYASIIERLRSVIVGKRCGKVSRGMLLLHDNAPIQKVQHCSG